MSTECHSVLLLSDQSVVRSGLGLLLRDAGWGEVVESPLEGSASVGSQRALPLGIVVVDAAQAWDKCLSAIFRIRQVERQAPVLVLSAHRESRYARAALEAGARGYVLEQASKEEFQVACRALHQGGIYLDPQVMPGLLMDLSRPEAELRKAAILAGLARGANNQALASELSLSVSSIKISIRELFAEYGVSNRMELLAAIGARNQFRSGEGLSPWPKLEERGT